jgi:hypothetical protein
VESICEVSSVLSFQCLDTGRFCCNKLYVPTGNPCSDDIDGNETSHKLLTIAIHRKLRLVDGQEITEEDRVNAAAYFQSLPEEAQDQVRELPNWTPDTTSGEDIQLVQATFERKQATAYSLEKNKRYVDPCSMRAKMLSQRGFQVAPGRIGVDVVLAELDELATVSRLSRPVSSRFGLVPTLQGAVVSFCADAAAH